MSNRDPGTDAFETRPFLDVRRAYLHVLEAGRRKNIIHGLIEIDVTEARRRLRQAEAAGRHLSFTAFLMSAVAHAVAEDRILHAYRQRNQLIMFHDLDVNTHIEVEVAGQHIVQSLIVRAAGRKSVEVSPTRFGRDAAAIRPRSAVTAARSPWSACLGALRRLAGGDVEPDLVQALRWHHRPELHRHVRPWRRLGHPDHTANADDHHRRHHHQTSISQRQPGAPGIARSHDLGRSRHRRRRPAARFARRLAELVEQADGL